MNDYLTELVYETKDCQEEEFLTEQISLPINTMYLLTNNIKVMGATVLLYDNLLQEISDQLDSSFILLPSSVHEVLIVPVENRQDMERYTNMVQEVNETQLRPDEVLSDHAYYYSRKYQVLS